MLKKIKNFINYWLPHKLKTEWETVKPGRYLIKEYWFWLGREFRVRRRIVTRPPLHPNCKCQYSIGHKTESDEKIEE